MKICQKFHLKQMYHEITFYAYDIEKIEKITPYNLSRIYVPECADRANKRCDFWKVKEVCCQCCAPQLQTGIRVPVNKEIYREWKKGWSSKPSTQDDKVYELGVDYEKK